MNYNDIVSASLGYADRQDAQVSNMVPTFIAIVESRLNRLIHIEDSSTRLAYAEYPTDGRYTLPTNFSSMVSVVDYPIDAPVQQRSHILVSPEQFYDMAAVAPIDGASYCITGNQLVSYPITPTTSIFEIVYYSTLDPLTVTTPSNWLSVNHPDLYIFGIVTEINAFVKDAESTALWNQRFLDATNEIIIADDALRMSGIAMQTRLG